MKRFIPICAILTILLTAGRLQATTYVGTISGEITAAQDASFYFLGLNSPLAVGTLIAGQYSYESPALNGSIFFGGGITDFALDLMVGDQIHISSLDLSLDWFRVSGGKVDVAMTEDGNMPASGGGYIRYHISLNENGLMIGELSDSGERSAQGTLSFSDPQPQSVPDPGSTLGMLALALLGLCGFRRR